MVQYLIATPNPGSQAYVDKIVCTLAKAAGSHAPLFPMYQFNTRKASTLRATSHKLGQINFVSLKVSRTFGLRYLSKVDGVFCS